MVLFRVGVFSTLTNSYALVAVGASENFYRFVLLSFFPRARAYRDGYGWVLDWMYESMCDGMLIWLCAVSLSRSCRMLFQLSMRRLRERGLLDG